MLRNLIKLPGLWFACFVKFNFCHHRWSLLKRRGVQICQWWRLVKNGMTTSAKGLTSCTYSCKPFTSRVVDGRTKQGEWILYFKICDSNLIIGMREVSVDLHWVGVPLLAHLLSLSLLSYHMLYIISYLLLGATAGVQTFVPIWCNAIHSRCVNYWYRYVNGMSIQVRFSCTLQLPGRPWPLQCKEPRGRGRAWGGSSPSECSSARAKPAKNYLSHSA